MDKLSDAEMRRLVADRLDEEDRMRVCPSCEKPIHSDHMEELRERWSGMAPNGLMLIAFMQDMFVIWRHRWAHGHWY